MRCDGLSVPDFQGSRQCQLIGFSNYWLNLLFNLYTVHFMMITQCFERTILLLKMFKDAYMNCFYFLHIFSGAKMLQKLEIHFATLSATSMVTTAKTSKKAVELILWHSFRNEVKATCLPIKVQIWQSLKIMSHKLILMLPDWWITMIVVLRGTALIHLLRINDRITCKQK